MEYTDYCPSCDQQVIVEEFPETYVIKNNRGIMIKYCPKCHMKLEVVDGVMSVVDDTV